MTMPRVDIPQAENLQLQSSLIRLPPEIKHIINTYCFCFAADEPITHLWDSPPGLALLLTCRRVYHEADQRARYSQNTFRFKTVDLTRTFLKSVGKDLVHYVQDIEIDIRRIRSNSSSLAQGWVRYLAWGSSGFAGLSGSLKEDAPGLKCLRLNFAAWPSLPMSRIGLWQFLLELLSHIEGLDRIVLIGASKGRAMEQREPWSTVHFVGGDHPDSGNLIQHMWRAVGGQRGLTKVIRWKRSEGRIELEVVKQADLILYPDERGAMRNSSDACWPRDGTCSWHDYQDWHSQTASSSVILFDFNQSDD